MIKYRLQQIGLLIADCSLVILWFVMFDEIRVNYLTMATNELIWLLSILCLYSFMIIGVYTLNDKIINELNTKIKDYKKSKEVK